MNDNSISEFENRQYVNPQTTVDERNAFIENLRQSQAEDINRINQETYNLGTDIPANKGGLPGASAEWQAQYVTPQTNTLVANLKATAQQAALNTALKNVQDQYQQRYNQAYQAYAQRQKEEEERQRAAYYASLQNQNSGGARLNINTGSGNDDIDVDSGNAIIPGMLGTDDSGTYLKTVSGKINLSDLQPVDNLQVSSYLASHNLKNGDTFTIGKQKYVFVQNNQTNGSARAYRAAITAPFKY